MPGELVRLLRSPDGWAYLLLTATALAAAIDGMTIVIGAAGTGEKAAAGWFIGVVGLVLIALMAAAVRQDLRGRQVSVMSELATRIIAEEEAAGREVEDHFQAELPQLPSRAVIRVLLLCTVLLAGWMVLLPWLGFSLTTGLFCLLFMLLVVRTRWWVALITGVAVGAVLAVLFSLVGVVLPAGALWYLI